MRETERGFEKKRERERIGLLRQLTSVFVKSLTEHLRGEGGCPPGTQNERGKEHSCMSVHMSEREREQERHHVCEHKSNLLRACSLPPTRYYIVGLNYD